MDVRKAFLYFDLRVFVLVRLSIPSQIALNRILWFIDQFKGLPFLFELVAVVSQCALCHGYKPCAQYLPENILSTRRLLRR